MPLPPRPSARRKKQPLLVSSCPSIFYFRDRRVYLDLIEFFWFRIKSCQMPDHWKTRRLQYMVGQKAFNQFCKQNGYTNTSIIYHSYYTQSWLRAFNKKTILPIIKE